MTWIFGQPLRGGGALPLDSFDKNVQMVEMCYRTHTTTINPIVDWTDGEVWEFIKEYNVPYCCLYDEGFKRLGCIGCPMGSKEQRMREFERWPKYKNLYLIAFEKMIENRGGTAEVSHSRRVVNGVDYGKQTAEDIMNGYITERFKDYIGGQRTAEQLFYEWSRNRGGMFPQRFQDDDTAGNYRLVD